MERAKSGPGFETRDWPRPIASFLGGDAGLMLSICCLLKNGSREESKRTASRRGCVQIRKKVWHKSFGVLRFKESKEPLPQPDASAKKKP
jgi:hypothetical protein